MKLSQQIIQWVDRKQPGWFSYAIIDSALDIQTPKQKTLRRVVIHNLYLQGKLVPHPTQHGVFLKHPPRISF